MLPLAISVCYHIHLACPVSLAHVVQQPSGERGISVLACESQNGVRVSTLAVSAMLLRWRGGGRPSLRQDRDYRVVVRVADRFARRCPRNNARAPASHVPPGAARSTRASQSDSLRRMSNARVESREVLRGLLFPRAVSSRLPCARAGRVRRHQLAQTTLLYFLLFHYRSRLLFLYLLPVVVLQSFLTLTLVFYLFFFHIQQRGAKLKRIAGGAANDWRCSVEGGETPLQSVLWRETRGTNAELIPADMSGALRKLS